MLCKYPCLNNIINITDLIFFSEAFQTIPVHRSQYPYQAVDFCGSIFICLKLTYGDRQACHRFSRTHEILIRCLVLPQVQLSRHNVELVVDDVTGVAPACQKHLLQQFDNTYTTTMQSLGFSVKKSDPSGFKAFQMLQKGEILGFVIDSNNLTWSLSVEKNNKILMAIDECFYYDDPDRARPIRLKTAQKALGKLQVKQNTEH